MMSLPMRTLFPLTLMIPNLIPVTMAITFQQTFGKDNIQTVAELCTHHHLGLLTLRPHTTCIQLRQSG